MASSLSLSLSLSLFLAEWNSPCSLKRFKLPENAPLHPPFSGIAGAHRLCILSWIPELLFLPGQLSAFVYIFSNWTILLFLLLDKYPLSYFTKFFLMHFVVPSLPRTLTHSPNHIGNAEHLLLMLVLFDQFIICQLPFFPIFGVIFQVFGFFFFLIPILLWASKNYVWTVQL